LFVDQLSTAWFQPWFWEQLSHSLHEDPMIYFLLNIVGFYGIKMDVQEPQWIDQWSSYLLSHAESLSLTASTEYGLYLLRALLGLICNF
jgi:hypothetical protein